MCDCSKPCLTTQLGSYQAPKAEDYPARAKKKEQSDEALISGHFINNLKIGATLTSTNVWPKATEFEEEYAAFLKRLQCCDKELYKMYFRCPDVNIKLIEQMLSDLEKSIYQLSYSPDQYVILKSGCYVQKQEKLKQKQMNVADYATTYRVFHNRWKEIHHFKDLIYKEYKKHSSAVLRKDLQRIYRTGTSTYYETICTSSILHTKDFLFRGPLDRHMDRRI